jgi:hypothetical protein
MLVSARVRTSTTHYTSLRAPDVSMRACTLRLHIGTGIHVYVCVTNTLTFAYATQKHKHAFGYATHEKYHGLIMSSTHRPSEVSSAGWK